MGPVGFGLIPATTACSRSFAQQVFPPRNVGVGFDTQRRGAIHHAKQPRPSSVCVAECTAEHPGQGRQAVSEMATTCTGCIRQKRWLAESHSGWLRSIRKLGGLLRFRRSRRGAAPLRVAGALETGLPAHAVFEFDLPRRNYSRCAVLARDLATTGTHLGDRSVSHWPLLQCSLIGTLLLTRNSACGA